MCFLIFFIFIFTEPSDVEMPTSLVREIEVRKRRKEKLGQTMQIGIQK